MSVQSTKYLLAIVLTGVVGLAPARMFGQAAAAPSSKAPQKNWKDRAEYDLYDSILKDTNPKTKLEKLQTWETKYPKTDFEAERQTLLLTTYVAANDPKDAVAEAKKILAENPKDFTALYYIMFYTQPLYAQNQSPQILADGEMAANAILMNIDTPPPNVAADKWNALKPQLELLAHKNLGFIAMQRMNWEQAETELQKARMMDPNDATLDYQLGTAIASEKKVDKLPTAMFYFARAATMQGKGALTAAAQQTTMTYLKKQYDNFHGSDTDFDKLLTAAKSSPNPPAGFTIKTAQEIAQAQVANENAFAQSHPEEALWANLKMELTGPMGEMYFDMSMKGALLPTLKGHVISLEPETHPKTITLAMEDASNNTTTADATLKFDMALPGKVDPGTELSFEGVPQSYTTGPFMVVFNVEKDKLHGWTGKDEPVHHRPRPRAKK